MIDCSRLVAAEMFLFNNESLEPVIHKISLCLRSQCIFTFSANSTVIGY